MNKSALFFLLFALLWRGYRQDDYNDKVAKNQLAPVISRLSIIARLINGISVQSDFMRSLQNLNAVVGELLDIGDSVPELLKLKVTDLKNDVDEVLMAVNKVSASSSQDLRAIGNAMKFLKSLDVENVKKAMETNLTVLEDKWDWARIDGMGRLRQDEFLLAEDGLKYILANPTIPSNFLERELFVDKLRNFSDNTYYIRSTFEPIEKKEYGLYWELLDSKPSFETSLLISKVAEEYSLHAKTFATLDKSLKSMKNSLANLESVIKKSQSSSTSVQTLDTIQNIFSTDKKADKTLTAGFYSGISELKLLFDDLNGKWLQENVAGGMDMKMLIAALEPLKKFYENLEPLESSWRKLRKGKKAAEVIGNIATILKNGKLLNAKEFKDQIDMASKCITSLTPFVFTSEFAKFKSFYAGLEKFDAEMKKLRDVIETVGKSPLVKKIEELLIHSLPRGDLTTDQLTAKLKKILDYEDIKPISQLMSNYLESLKKVDIEMITEMLELSPSAFAIQRKLTRSNLIPSVECMNKEKFDYTGTIEFTRFQQSVEVIKTRNDISPGIKAFKEAVEVLISSEEKLKEKVDGMKRRRRRSDEGSQGLLKMENSSKIAREVGNAVQVLREMEEVFENREKVKKVAKSMDSVDSEIQRIPEMAGKWTVENKKALEELEAEVYSVELNVPKNKSLKVIWEQFGNAQRVGGTPIDAKILGDVVFGVLNASRDANVTKAAVDFKNFPPLQLDFTGSKRKYLREASMLLDPITSFFKDYFVIETSTPPVSVGPDYVAIGLGVGGALLLIGLLVGGFVFYWKYRAKKRLNKPEK